MSSELPSDAPEPRLCHLVKWPDFDGYGFNLHAEKAKSGQFIGKVDEDSPADHANLREGDRIVEVNGVNIANENHRQVVERIKAVPNETKLLVLHDEADRWYKERKLVVKGTQANVKYVKTPVPRPLGGVVTKASKPREENVRAAPIANGNSSAPHSETQSLADSSRSSTPKTEPKPDDSCSSARSASPADSPIAHVKAPNDNTVNDSNTLNGSATNGSSRNGSVHSATPPPVAKAANAKSDSVKKIEKTSKTESVKSEKSESVKSAKTESVKSTKTESVKSAKTESVKSAKTESVKTAKSESVKAKTEVAKPESKADGVKNSNGKAPQDSEMQPSSNGKSAVDGEVKNAKPSASSGELNFNMSAAQMREMLANRKKNDPKKQSMDMREKYQIVQQM